MMLLHLFSLCRFLIFVKLMIHYHQSKQMDGSLLCALLLFSVKFSQQANNSNLLSKFFFSHFLRTMCACVCFFIVTSDCNLLCFGVKSNFICDKNVKGEKKERITRTHIKYVPSSFNCQSENSCYSIQSDCKRWCLHIIRNN